MGRDRRWLGLIAVLCLFALSSAREIQVKHETNKAVYNHTLATILVEYASAVYVSDLMDLFTWTCDRCNDFTKGFEVIELVVDVQHCLQAFVGVAEDLNAIVIAFRGTQEHSIQNWIEDLYWKQLDINYPGMPGAMVHHGFYFSYHNTTIRHGILNAIKRAKKLYGDIDIIVTGHSMGGAMASFCALDLAVWLYDVSLESLVYTVEKVCDSSGEDPSCCRSVSGKSILDHLAYYGVELMAETWNSCKIVNDPRLEKYSIAGHRGNLILSKNPAASIIESRGATDAGRNSI